MLAQMTHAQFQNWMEFAQLEPFGDQRADLRMGILASLTANVHRDPKRHPNVFQATDFMPFVDDRRVASRGARAPLTAKGYSEFKSLAKTLARAR